MDRNFFFTTRVVKQQIDATSRRVLSRFGAFTRRRAKSSLKYKDGASQPGKPPHVHRGRGKGKKQGSSPLRELVFFSFDPANKSVVVGPAIGGSRSGAPRTLEEGGTARVAGRTVTVRPRPTMRPAFQVELRAVGKDFENQLKGS